MSHTFAVWFTIHVRFSYIILLVDKINWHTSSYTSYDEKTPGNLGQLAWKYVPKRHIEQMRTEDVTHEGFWQELWSIHERWSYSFCVYKICPQLSRKKKGIWFTGLCFSLTKRACNYSRVVKKDYRQQHVAVTGLPGTGQCVWDLLVDYG